MRIVLFHHSFLSDWDHGNASFLRGVVSETFERGFDVRVFEEREVRTGSNLIWNRGELCDPAALDPAMALDGADLVLVHETTDRALIARIGLHHAVDRSYRLLFYDTHRRTLTDPLTMSSYDLRYYDGVLAFSDSVRDFYRRHGWARRAWTWHEAADTRVFYPRPNDDNEGDVVWIGNWGDEEQTAEIEEFFLRPVKRLGLRAAAYGVRYPDAARERLAAYGVEYRGWLPNADVPVVFGRYKATVHVPRRPYVEALPGLPTIHPFEALACGIPLVSARWSDPANLFEPGDDFLVAHDGDEMAAHLARLMTDEAERVRLTANGLAAVTARHTCAHRVDELMTIFDAIATEAPVPFVNSQASYSRRSSSTAQVNRGASGRRTSI